jgi:hypothetical protein
MHLSDLCVYMSHINKIMKERQKRAQIIIVEDVYDENCCIYLWHKCMFLLMLCFTICATSCLAFRFPITSHNELEIDLLCIFFFTRWETAIQNAWMRKPSCLFIEQPSECDLLHFSPLPFVVNPFLLPLDP